MVHVPVKRGHLDGAFVFSIGIKITRKILTNVLFRKGSYIICIRYQLVNNFYICIPKYIYEINKAETKRFVEAVNTLLKCKKF